MARPSLSEKALSSRSGADYLGFTAGPANDAKMNRDMLAPPPPKQSDKAARRSALNTLAGGTVNIRRGGTSASAVNKFRASTEKVVEGAASALAEDEEEGLMAVQAAAEKRLASVRARKAKEAEDAATEAYDMASSSSVIVVDDRQQHVRQEENHERRQQQQSSRRCLGDCSDARCVSPFESVLGDPSLESGCDNASSTNGIGIGTGTDADAGSNDNDNGSGSVPGAAVMIIDDDDCDDNDYPDLSAPKTPAYYCLDEPPPHLRKDETEDWYVFKNIKQDLADWMVNQRPKVRRPIHAA